MEPLRVGADPETARLVLADRVDHLGREPLLLAVTRHLAVPEAHQAVAEGAQPQGALTILEEGQHAVRAVGVGRGGGHGLEEAALPAKEPLVVGAHPEPALTVLEEGGDELSGRTLGRQALGGADGPEAVLLVANESATVAAHPQRAGSVLVHRKQRLLQQPFGFPVGGEAHVAEAVQPLNVGADPQAPLAVLEESEDDGAGEALVLRIDRDLLSRDAGHSPALGADPEVAVAVFDDGRHRLLPRAPAPGPDHGDDAAPLEPADAIAGSDPQLAVPRHEEGAHRVAREPVPHRERLQAVGEPHETVSVRAEPERPRRLRHGQHDVLAAQLGRADEAVSLEAGKALARPDPKAALLVHEQGSDAVAGQARGLAEGGEHARGKSHQPIRGADPQGALAVFAELADVVVTKGRLVLLVEEGEADPVEADQPLLGAQPEEPVTRLEHRLDGVLGKALKGGIDGMAVLSDGAGRIEGARGHGRENEKAQRGEGGPHVQASASIAPHDVRERKMWAIVSQSPAATRRTRRGPDRANPIRPSIERGFEAVPSDRGGSAFLRRPPGAPRPSRTTRGRGP